MSYERVLELVRLTHAAVTEARWEELPRLEAARAAAVASLPGAPPASARPLLEEALRVTSETEAALSLAMAETAAAIASIRSGRRMLAAYAGEAPRPVRGLQRLA